MRDMFFFIMGVLCMASLSQGHIRSATGIVIFSAVISIGLHK